MVTITFKTKTRSIGHPQVGIYVPRRIQKAINLKAGQKVTVTITAGKVLPFLEMNHK